MKRNIATILLSIGVTVLLIVLGVLQYRWQSTISENESQRMHKLVQENTGRFAEDFNKEIQNAYFNFQVGADDWRAGNYHPFLERYDFWRAKTSYPGLISEFYFFDAAGKNPPLRFDDSNRTFVPVEWTPELRDIANRTKDEKTFRAVNDDIYTLILPQYEASPRLEHMIVRRTAANIELGNEKRPAIPPEMDVPKTFGYLAIRLDKDVISSRVLPAMVEKNFGERNYNIRITDRQGSTVYQTANMSGEPDATSGIFELTPNDVYFFANRDLTNAVSERKQNVVLTSRMDSHTITRTDVSNKSQGTVKVEIKSDQKPRTEVFTAAADTPGEHWTLATQHSAGSIDAYVTQNKDRDLGIGFGILALIGISAGAIIYSASRIKAFAQRQMDFVSSVSHEFRTPLAVIYSAGENLADGVTNDAEQASRYGELIKAEGRKLSGMVEQILEFAGANSGRRKYNFEMMPVDEVVNDAIGECRSLLSDQSIKVECDIDSGLPEINADHEALSRAIQNLIVNSIKYRNGSGWLRISACNGGDTVKISVEDHGIGISKGDLKQIFEPFYRSKEVVDAQIHGNGLGLALVKQITEAHGGRVTAESEPGKGSKFTIELPVN
jgi:signal transduction histidine kinase